MKKNIGYSFLLLGILVFCLSFGIYLGFKYTKNNEELIDYQDTTASDKEIVEEDTTPVSAKNCDIEVVYKDEYQKCGHVILTKNIIYNTTIDKLKEKQNTKQKEKGNIYELEDESDEKVIYTRKINQNCPNHFLVKLNNDNIVIYNVVDESAIVEYRRMDVDLETLNPEMLEELNQGIIVDSKEDLNLVIEDLES